MTLLLPLLSLPLLAAVVVLPTGARGIQAARCILVVFALATLAEAIGTLDPDELHLWASADRSNALFVSISIGLVTGALVPWPPSGRLGWLAGLPLVVVLLTHHAAVIRWGPLVLGVVLGSLPLLLAWGLPRRRPQEATVGASARTGWQILSVATVLALIEPLLLVLVSPVLPLVWQRGERTGWQPAWRQLTWPLLATVAAIAVGWLALTVAGNPLVRLGNFAAVAPVSLAGERLLALLATLLLVAMASPWPFHRFGVGTVLVPAAVILAHRFATTLAPGGMPEWRALAAMLLVLPATGAAIRGYWPHVLVLAALLTAMHGTAWSAGLAVIALAAGLAMIALPRSQDPTVHQRVSFPSERGTALAAAIGLAAAPAVLLSDEVVLATLLAFGLATAAARPSSPGPAA